jgi:hypothetical protein
VRIINLEAGYALARKLIELPGYALFGQGITQPPIKAHFPLSGRRIPESRQNVEAGRPIGIPGRQRFALHLGLGCQRQTGRVKHDKKEKKMKNRLSSHDVF